MNDLTIEWKNFRGFRMEGPVTLKPLTFIIGKNNVGKSSLYAPLLALKQTLSATQAQTALLTRGDLVDLGTYQDIVWEHREEEQIELNFSLPLRTGRPRRGGGAEPGELRTTFASPDGVQARLVEQAVMDSFGKRRIHRKRGVDVQEFSTFDSNFLPSSTPGRPRQEVAALKKSMRAEQPTGFLFDGVGALMLPANYRRDRERWAKVQDWFTAAYDLYDFQRATNASVRNFLNNLEYIGPLRRTADRTYRRGAESPSGVGRDGENAPELIYEMRETGVFRDINAWLERLGYGALTFQSVGDDYFQVFLNDAQRGLKVNIAHTGTGVSQIIPVLAQGILAKSDSTVIFQQPEIHLNPAQQTTVMDFLIDRALAGVRLLVESHSEHMLLRLRRRIAEGELTSSQVAVFYVEATAPGASTVREVELDDLGNLEADTWPKGFFSESLDDAFKLAIAQSRAGNA